MDRGQIADVLAHSRQAENVMGQAGDKGTKKKEKLGERLQMAQLQAYEQQTHGGIGHGRERGLGRG